MNHHCPVCNKAGLPDYSATPTICPQCNSNLKPFLLLHSISRPNKPTLFALVALTLVGCALAILYFNSISDKKLIVSETGTVIIQLQDSINVLKSQSALSEIKPDSEEIVIQYKVKDGDYTSKIAQFFYNDWKMYKKIESDNNLKHPYILKVGQPLTIKFSQE